MSNLCWRCITRKTSFNTKDFKFSCEDYLSNYSSSFSDKERCFTCKDLLLIDNRSKYCILKIPNEVKKLKRRKSKKSMVIQDSQSGIISSYAIYKQDCISNEIKNKSIEGYIGEIFNDSLTQAISNENGLKITEVGISIELTPELRTDSDQEMQFSLKNCLRSLLLSQIPVNLDINANLEVCQNQINNLRLNQNSELYINFIFSTKLPSNIEHTEGFMFSIVISHTWKSAYLMGRYIKLSRRMSQSKWGFSDSDKNKIVVDASVEEILSSSLKKLINFDKFTFSSSGREDVDVRMLGKYANRIFDRDLELNKSQNYQIDICDDSSTPTGRPFAIEIGGILNHHYLFYPKIVHTLNLKQNSNYYSREDFLQLFKDTIRNESDSRLEVSDLKFSDYYSVQKMNKEVNEKQKSYRCVCYTPTPIDFNLNFKILENFKFPIILNQRTPIRVLHRRPNIDRCRKIYDLMIYPINENYFILDLLAQAGTYIKEFVNGDLGRTFPSLGDLIQESLSMKHPVEENLNIIIVQLDVLNIH